MLTEPKGALYYFKTADDPPNYKGIVNMRECKAEDVEARRCSFPMQGVPSPGMYVGGCHKVTLMRCRRESWW